MSVQGRSRDAIHVTRLSHVAVGVRDLNRQASFYVDTWGLNPMEATGSELFLRAEATHHHVLQLQSGRPGLEHIAFGVAEDADLDRAAELLTALEVPLLVGPTRGLEPGVGRLLRFRDPEGTVIELVADVEDVWDPPPAPHAVTPISLNHVVLFAADLKRQQRFYQEVLGFRLSDTIGNFMAFLRCNTNHHSLGLIGLPGTGLQHAAFDVRDRQELANGLFRMGDGGFKRVHGPGRHGPSNMLFSYYEDPERNVVEYCTEIAQVDDARHTPRNWPMSEAMNLWRAPDRPGPPPGLEWTVSLLPVVRRARAALLRH